MLSHGALLALWIALSVLQTGVAEQVKCNFTVLESKVSSLSASIQWRTFGSPCNFSLIYSSDTSGPLWCHPILIDNFTYGCDPKDLQAGTIYNFRIVSLDGEERSLVLQTDPLPPARLEVNPERTTSTTLQVRWTPSSGKVTWYEVQLFDQNNQKIQEVQVQELRFYHFLGRANCQTRLKAKRHHSGAGPVNNRLFPLPTADRACRGRERTGRTWPRAVCQPSLSSRVRGHHNPGDNDRAGATLQTLLPMRDAGGSWRQNRSPPPDSRLDLPSQTPHSRPHHGGRSTLRGRVPLPDPVGPAQGWLVGQRSRKMGERVRKDATHFQRRGFRGTAHVGGACGRSLPRDKRILTLCLGTGVPSCFFPSFPQNI